MDPGLHYMMRKGKSPPRPPDLRTLERAGAENVLAQEHGGRLAMAAREKIEKREVLARLHRSRLRSIVIRYSMRPLRRFTRLSELRKKSFPEQAISISVKAQLLWKISARDIVR